MLAGLTTMPRPRRLSTPAPLPKSTLMSMRSANRQAPAQLKALARQRTGVSLPEFVDKAMVAYLACRQLPAGFAHLSVLTAAAMYWPHHPKREWGRVSVPAR